MTRQKFDTPPAALAHLSPQARLKRAERVAELKALVEARLYQVDTAALVRAMLRPPGPGAFGVCRRSFA